MKPHNLDVMISVATVNETAVCLITGTALVGNDETVFLRGVEEIIEMARSMAPDEVAMLWEAFERMQRCLCSLLQEKNRITR